MLRMIFSLAACGLLASLGLAEDKYVKLVHVASDKVLSVADNSDEAGAKAVVAKDDGGKSQQWKLEKDGDHYKIVNRKSGKVLDVEQESLEDGGAIIFASSAIVFVKKCLPVLCGLFVLPSQIICILQEGGCNHANGIFRASRL